MENELFFALFVEKLKRINCEKLCLFSWKIKLIVQRKTKGIKHFIEIMRNYYYFQLQNEWHEHVWNIFWENRTKHKGCREISMEKSIEKLK